MMAMRQEATKIGGFLIVGGVNSALTFLIYQALVFVLPYWLAYSLCFVLGIGFSFLANSRFVFSISITFRRALAYTVFYLSSYAIGLGMLSALVEQLHMHLRLAPVIVVIVMTPLNYLGAKMCLKK